MKTTLYALVCVFFFGCVQTPVKYESPQQIAQRKAEERKLKADLHNLLEVNTVYNAFSNPKFLKNFAAGVCKTGQLVIDNKTNLFIIKNEMDRNCVKKWSDGFTSYLNKKYQFSVVNIDFEVSYTKDTSTLGRQNFKNLETFTRQMFKNAFIAEANRRQQEQELEQIRQAEIEYQNRQRRAAALADAANTIGRAISGASQSSSSNSYTAPTNSYAMPTNGYRAPANSYSSGGKLYSNDGKFLGNVNDNQYDPNSISNPYGKYGSKYSADSVNNPYGNYGSKYSNDSVNNPYGAGAKIYSNDGKYLGNVNGNQYDPNSTSNPYGKYGNQYSPDSINNPYGTYGNPYSNQYVPNTFGN